MVGSLLVVQDRHGRQYAGQVAGQEDHRVRLATKILLGTLLDVLQRVGGATVLGQAGIGVVRQTGTLVEDHVLQYSAELDGLPDYRLVLLGQVDALGVAATLDVEHATNAPAVLVVTDQVAALVGRQGGLAGAGQTEEQGGVAVFADVGGAVHRQHIHVRQQEVLHGEHGFLHFTGVLHAGDQHLLLGEVDDHAAIGIGAVTLGYALEERGVEDAPLAQTGRVELLGGDEQAAAEQVVPGGLGGHLDRQVVLGIGTDMDMGHEAVTLADIGFDAAPQGFEVARRERTVDRAPGDLVLGAGLFDDEAVSRRTTRAVPGLHHQRAIGGQFALSALDGFFNQLSGADVGVHGVGGLRHECSRRPWADSSMLL